MKKCISLLLVISLSGCTSLKPMEKGLPPEEIRQNINLGDAVVIKTRDAKKYQVQVEAIDLEGIWSGGKIYKYDEIEEIHTREHSTIKTVAAGGVAYVAIWAVGIVLVFAWLGAL